MACYDSYGESIFGGEHVFHRLCEYTVKSVDDDAGVVYLYEVESPFVARSVTICTENSAFHTNEFECRLCGFRFNARRLAGNGVPEDIDPDMVNYCPGCGRPVHHG